MPTIYWNTHVRFTNTLHAPWLAPSFSALPTVHSPTPPLRSRSAHVLVFLLHPSTLLSLFRWLLGLTVNVGEPPSWNQVCHFPLSALPKRVQSSILGVTCHVLIIAKFISLIHTALPWVPGLDFQLSPCSLHQHPKAAYLPYFRHGLSHLPGRFLA